MRTTLVLTVVFLGFATACSSPAARDTGGSGNRSGDSTSGTGSNNPVAANHDANPQTGVHSGAVGSHLMAPSTACLVTKGKTYDVGDDKKYRSIGAVPLEKLKAGDRVLIHWRKEPYREKILLSASGTKDRPISICGVPGPNGELPVISGENATTRKQSIFPWEGTQDRGLVVFTIKKPQRWGYKPKWIVLQNLVLRSAYRGIDEKNLKGFTDAKGKHRTYSTNAASIFVERGEHITVRNCVITDSAYGLFVASADSEEVLSRDITLEGSYVYGNGTPNVDRRHNVYTEAAGILIQGNRFGPQRAGAKGNQIKDRSAGTVVRYNWIEGGAHLLDLVEPEEAWPMLKNDPRLRKTYVYGNIMISGPRDGSSMLHYGGDNGNANIYRKGTLYFFNNTVIVRASERERWNTTMFRVATNDETVDARNNIIWRQGSTHLTLMKRDGKVVFGTNWVSSGYKLWQYESPKKGRSAAGEDNLLTGDNPGFAEASKQDFRLEATAKAASASGALPDNLGTNTLDQQYRIHQQVRARAKAGAGSALGALQP